MSGFEIKKTLKLVKPSSNTYKALRDRNPLCSIFYCFGCDLYVVSYIFGPNINMMIWLESGGTAYDLDHFDYDIQPRLAMCGHSYVTF